MNSAGDENLWLLFYPYVDKYSQYMKNFKCDVTAFNQRILVYQDVYKYHFCWLYY